MTLGPEGLKLVGKGRRKGLEIKWDSLTSGEAALATALNASINPKLNLEPGRAAVKKPAKDAARALRLRLVKGAKRGRPSQANGQARRRAH